MAKIVILSHAFLLDQIKNLSKKSSLNMQIINQIVASLY